MRSLILVMTIILTSATASTSPELIKFSVSSFILPNKELSMELDVVTPRTPGKYPAILFLTGMAGLTPSYCQQKLIESVAEQGYVWMTISKMQSPNPEKVTQGLSKAVDWINGNLQDVLNTRAPAVQADLEDRFILMAHSAGGHVTNAYLNSTCGNVKMFIMLSPVDGADPLGIKKDFIITPGLMLPFAVPTMIIGTGLDHVAKKLMPACAPDQMANNRFYGATSGPKWFVNATQYGHLDFLNTEYREAGMMCPSCSKNCDFPAYRNFIKEMVLSFSDAIFKKDPLALQHIESGSFSIDVNRKHDYMGYDPLRGGFCQRVGQKEPKKELHLTEA